MPTSGSPVHVSTYGRQRSVLWSDNVGREVLVEPNRRMTMARKVMVGIIVTLVLLPFLPLLPDVITPLEPLGGSYFADVAMDGVLNPAHAFVRVVARDSLGVLPAPEKLHGQRGGLARDGSWPGHPGSSFGCNVLLRGVCKPRLQ